ncbi:MAG TPA: hypothetical protein P5277_03345 [Candidatus Paceibacterota bacterium]|nr:hypothetical protein [Candidatus Paceibacterota bacterium]
MYPKNHIIYGFIFSLFIFFVFPSVGWFGSLTIFLSSILIDFDHYIYFIWKKRNLSIKKSYNWYIDTEKKYSQLPKELKRKVYFGFYFLHGIEAIILLLITYFLTKQLLFIYILVGFVFHQILDFIELRIRNIKSYKLISFFYSIYKKRNCKSLDDVKWKE